MTPLRVKYHRIYGPKEDKKPPAFHVAPSKGVVKMLGALQQIKNKGQLNRGSKYGK